LAVDEALRGVEWDGFPALTGLTVFVFYSGAETAAVALGKVPLVFSCLVPGEGVVCCSATLHFSDPLHALFVACVHTCEAALVCVGFCGQVGVAHLVLLPSILHLLHSVAHHLVQAPFGAD